MFRFSLVLAAFSAFLIATASYAETVTQHTLSTDRGNLSFTVRRYLNPLNEPEMVIELDDARAFWKIPVPVLYARDTSGAGKFDAWFVPQENGTVDAVERIAKEDDGWDVASDLLVQAKVHERGNLSFLIQALSSGFTINGAMTKTFFQGISFQEINLQELDIRTERMLRENPKDPDVTRQALFQFQELSDGWAEVSRQIQNYRVKDLPLEVLADVALLAGGSWLGEKAAPLMERTGSAFLGTSLGKLLEESYAKMASAIADQASQISEKVGLKKLAEPVVAFAGESAARAEFVKLTLQKQVETILQALSARDAISKIIAQGLRASAKAVGTVAREGVEQLPAVAEAEGIQIAAELFARRKEIFQNGHNPLVVAKNLFADKDVIQDLLFQANAEFWMDGIASYNSNNSFKKKMILCGVFGFADSSVINLGVKHDFDPGRNAMDTGWESVAGSLSANLDMIALGSFEKIATRTGNPSLKFVGYAVMAVVEVGENLGYTYLSKWYDGRHKVIVAPVFQKQ